MNRLDNLPVDIKKIINRKVQDLHVKERRIERKKNRANNRLLKHKKNVREKFIDIVKEKIEDQKNKIIDKQEEKNREIFLQKRNDSHKRLNLIIEDIKKKPVASSIVETELFIEIDNPFIIFTLIDGNKLICIPNKYDLNYKIVSKNVYMILEQQGLLNSL